MESKKRKNADVSTVNQPPTKLHASQSAPIANESTLVAPEQVDEEIKSFSDSRLTGSKGILVYAHSATGFVANSDKAKHNQDRWLVNLANSDDDVHLFGVCDGHGAAGEVVSGWVAANLPIALSEEKRAKARPGTAIPAIVRKVASRLQGFKPPPPVDISQSGTTACFSILSGRRLVVANIGDSRCILARATPEICFPSVSDDSSIHIQPAVVDPAHFSAVQITRDHSPDDPEERKRITQAGGRVGVTAPGQPARIFQGMRNYPGLAVARSLGDFWCQGLGVISKPDVHELVVNPPEKG
jgi:serine/threonine protein phosphatase PrpC